MRQSRGSSRTRPPAAHFGVLLISVALFAVAIPAPQAQPPQQPRPSLGAQPPQQLWPSQLPHLSQQPQFEAAVNRVRVDVIVTDDEGNFVEDLVPQDFRLFEDGVEQQILQTQLVNLDAGFIRDLSAMAAGSSGFSGPGDPGSDPVADAAEESSLEAGDFGAMVYVLDIGQLGYWERRRFARGWAELLEQTESYGFPRAVYMIDYLGYLRELAPLTYDVGLLQGLSTDLLTAVYTESDQDWVFEHPDWQSNVSDASDEGLTEAASRIRSEVQAENTAEFLSAICNSLLGRQGRKALVWVCPGLRISSARGSSRSHSGSVDLRALEAWEEMK